MNGQQDRADLVRKLELAKANLSAKQNVQPPTVRSSINRSSASTRLLNARNALEAFDEASKEARS